MTEAEQVAAETGHPAGNCYDCGRWHTPWSAHFNPDGSRIGMNRSEYSRQLAAILTRTLGYEVHVAGPLFYEGDDPDGFAAQMRDEFGFDPAVNPEWGKRITYETPAAGAQGFLSYPFWPPAEYRDKIHDDESLPTGC
jgi:hypothetical protein